MLNPEKIIPVKQVIDFCKKHPIIAKLSLFGSALTDEFKDSSDVDFLIEFEPEKTPSLFMLVNLEYELTDIVGRKADLRTAEDLSRYFRDEVVSQAKTLYDKS